MVLPRFGGEAELTRGAHCGHRQRAARPLPRWPEPEVLVHMACLHLGGIASVCGDVSALHFWLGYARALRHYCSAVTARMNECGRMA